MLSKPLRLNPKSIAQIAYRGRKVSGKLMDIRISHENGLQSPQFAISISKKIDKRAVVRNRIKRRLRAAIVAIIASGQVRPAKYLILVRSAEIGEKEVDAEEQLRRLIIT